METTVSAVSVALILGAPLAQNAGMSFSFIGNPLTRLLLIAYAVYAVRLGAFPGLLGFLAVMTLLTERNHEVLTEFPNQKPRWPSNNFGMPIAPAPLMGVKEEHSYEPPHYEAEEVTGRHEETEHTADKYDEASDLGDGRADLPVPQQGTHAAPFFEQKGLAATELAG
jgi:hypothetical protein